MRQLSVVPAAVRHFAASLLVFGLVLAPSDAGRAQSSTPGQVESIRDLSPEQQRAVIEAMGAGNGANARSGVTRSDRPLETPVTVVPRLRVGGVERELTPEGEPRLAAGDTLIIEIEPVIFEGQERILTERRPEPGPVVPGTTVAGAAVTGSTSPSAPVMGAAAPGAAAPAGSQALAQPPVRQTQIERSEDAKELLRRYVETVRRGNPYRLSRTGSVDLPGLGPVSLVGLTALQATQRLAIEPYLRDYRIRITFLPLEPTDADALKPFGYELFAGVPSTFAPATDIPVPSEYVVGPGDRLDVQLVGNTKARYSLVVNRDGRIQFPELGPISVSGLRIDEAKARVESRVQEQMIGTQASVSMGDLRSIRVFVLGDAERPGSYTVSGLATITNALFVSGGVKTNGSLRNIQLKRNGRTIETLDLYDLLLNGDTSSDARLLPGDVIFIPPVGATVGVTGEVRRPAIYELAGESRAADLLYLGGGLTPEADPKLAKLERIDERRERVVVGADLTNPEARGMRLRAGDLLRIPAVRPTYANSVELAGHVLRPAAFEYRSGLRLTDVIASADELKPNADQHYVLIRREEPGTRRVQVVSADLAAAWRSPQSEANPRLAPRDRVYVFDLETDRHATLAPILEELKRQAVSSDPSQVVRVSGRVRVPGDYPLEPGMTVSDLIRAGGGLAEDAYGGEAELARYEVRGGTTREAAVLKVHLGRAVALDPASDIMLAPFDLLVVKGISEWSETQETVRLQGEVRFPGEYPIERGETLQSVIARAGGLTPLAFSQGSVFTRESLKEREKEQIRILADRLRQDLGTLALQAAQAPGSGAQQATETFSIGQRLLADLQDTVPVGRLVIDLDRIIASQPGGPGDLVLKDGDTLRVPRAMQEVTVIGEVQYSTSHLYDASLSRDDYLRLSGGVTQKADERRIYVVRANGSVESGSGSRWFRQAGTIQPGDTIVVPLDAERMRPLPLWQAVTTIIFNLAVAVAAVNSF
jgi:protein involved in polysaccharide export with SLBB domain